MFLVDTMDLTRFLPGLPDIKSFGKVGPYDWSYAFENVRDDVIEAYRKFLSPFVEIPPGRDGFRVFLEQAYISPPLEFNLSFGYVIAEHFYSIRIANELRRLGFTAKFDGSIVLMDMTELINNFANTATVTVLINKILGKFPRRAELYTEVSFPNIYLKTTEDRTLLEELIVYLDAYMSETDRVKYAKISQDLIASHYQDEFDNPIVLILSAQLSAILSRYGIKTSQSNLDWGQILSLRLSSKVATTILSCWPNKMI